MWRSLNVKGTKNPKLFKSSRFVFVVLNGTAKFFAKLVEIEIFNNKTHFSQVFFKKIISLETLETISRTASEQTEIQCSCNKNESRARPKRNHTRSYKIAIVLKRTIFWKNLARYCKINIWSRLGEL